MSACFNLTIFSSLISAIWPNGDWASMISSPPLNQCLSAQRLTFNPDQRPRTRHSPSNDKLSIIIVPQKRCLKQY